MYNKTKKILSEQKLQPQKRFGQNFLVQQSVAEKIVHLADIQSDDTIYEVGVGLGALTLPLAAKAKQVIGLEIDSGIVRYHNTESNLPENVTVLHQDVLKADFSQLYERNDQKKIKLIANLPYSISNPFIFTLIENQQLIDTATIMLQKEVALRLMAQVGSKEYGIPTVLLRRCATVENLLTLGPSAFHPKPKIDSVVVKISFSQQAYDALGTYDTTLFTQIVRSAFSQRRKTILNTISNCHFFSEKNITDKGVRKQITAKVIESSGLSLSARAETLDVADFIRLSQHLSAE